MIERSHAWARALRLEFQEYVIAIMGWDWSYSLSLDTSRDRSSRPPLLRFFR
jgi:hypothetical protein